MNPTRIPSMVLAVLGILLLLVGLQLSSKIGTEQVVKGGMFFLSGVILFAAAGIAWAISDVGRVSQNDESESGN